MVFDIQRLSVHDGPGIRTTVFLKGCPLRCVWCHNPESQSFTRSMGLSKEKCTLCGECAMVCDAHKLSADGHVLDRSACIACGKCADACLNGAILSSGREATVEEVMADVLRDRIFYKNSGGGVTFSGGEPLSQPAFLKSLLRAAKEAGLHTCVDTSGYGSSESIRAIAPDTDLFLFDWKESDNEKHLQFTGVSNEPIKQNLELLCELGAKVILRCPIIPGLNDTESHLKGIAELAAQHSCITAVNIMAFHKLGDGKYTAFSMENGTKDIPQMEKADAALIADAISAHITRLTDRTITVE